MTSPARYQETRIVREALKADGLPILKSEAVELGLKEEGEYLIDHPGNLEGGDVLFLDEKTMLVGKGQRTNNEATEQLKRRIFSEEGFNGIEELVVVNIPAQRTSIHLDTLLGILDKDLLVAYLPALQNVTWHHKGRGGKLRSDKLTFDDYIERKNPKIHIEGLSYREQYNMAANVLMIKPKTIVAYDRSFSRETKNHLREREVEILELEYSELFFAGGGPHCMVLELERESK